MPEQLVPQEMPDCLNYLWQWFCELSNGRSYGEFGPMSINYSEIKAWTDLTHSEPTAWEVEALKSIDRAFLAEAFKK